MIGSDLILNRNEIKENDYGGRRSGLERRWFSYFAHIPERRTGKDRRSRLDRRKLWSSKPEAA